MIDLQSQTTAQPINAVDAGTTLAQQPLDTPSQLKLAALESQVNESLTRAYLLGETLDNLQGASSATASQQEALADARSQLGGLDQTLREVQHLSESANTAGAVDQLSQTADLANRKLISLQHQVETLALGMNRNVPNVVAAQVDGALTQVNQEIGWLTTKIAEWNLEGSDIGHHDLRALEQDHKELFSLKQQLQPQNFALLSDYDQQTLLNDARSQVNESYAQMNNTRADLNEKIQAHGDFYESALGPFKSVRDLTISLAQAAGKSVGGSAGGALGGVVQTAVVRLASEAGVNITAHMQDLTPAETAQLRQQTRDYLGPAWSEFVAGGASPLIDESVGGYGDFVTAFSTTLVTDLGNGKPMAEAWKNALETGYRAQGLGAAADSIVNKGLK